MRAVDTEILFASATSDHIGRTLAYVKASERRGAVSRLAAYSRSMHMIIGRRQDARLAVYAFDLVEQKLCVAPSFTGTLLVLQQPARSHIARPVEQEFHVISIPMEWTPHP